jgi:fucose 4-O-acetylase-like acetyltransferase
MTTRYAFIDVARGLAIVCVVVGHLSTRMDPAYYQAHLAIVNSLAFSFAMPFFFMVSAVFNRKRVENPALSGGAFVRSISSSLLKPFYTLSLLFMLVNLAAPKSLGLPGVGEMARALLIEQSSENLPSGVLWFLFVLFVFSLGTFVLVRLLKVNAYYVLAGAILLKVFASALRDTHILAVDKIAYFYVHYMAGYMLAGFILGARALRSWATIAASFAYWLFTAGRRDLFHLPYSRVYDWITVSHALIGVSGSLCLLGVSSRIDGRFPSGAVTDFIRYCGRNSILIYVFHTPTSLAVERFNAHFGLGSNPAGYAILCVTGIALPLLYGKILSRSATAYRLLLGRGPS